MMHTKLHRDMLQHLCICTVSAEVLQRQQSFAQYRHHAKGRHAWLACSLSSNTFMASVHCCSAPATLDSAPATSTQRKL